MAQAGGAVVIGVEVVNETDTLVGSGTLVDRAVTELAALHHLVEQTLGVDSAHNWLVIALVVVGVGWASTSERGA